MVHNVTRRTSGRIPAPEQHAQGRLALEPDLLDRGALRGRGGCRRKLASRADVRQRAKREQEKLLSAPLKNHMTASCSCGSVELKATGTPIVNNVCYCDDCQEGSRQIEALPNSRPVRNTDGGTAYILYRKDRIECSRGASLLKRYKIKESSVTNRVVATCCNSAMFMNFDRGRHWVSAYRARFQGNLPPLQMRICTKFKPENVDLPNDPPSYPGYPLRFMAKLLTSWVAMLLHR